MSEAVYDRHVQFYLEFVDRELSNQGSFQRRLVSRFEALLAGRLPGASVCDIACGEGYLSRALCRLGPRRVIGIDLSAALIAEAIRRSDGANLTYRVDDAQELRTVADASVDIAVSQLALMDIPDHRALFRAVRRILVPGGAFVLSLLHPCFEAPFHEPEASPYVVDASGQPVAFAIRRYASEGFWRSGGNGVRGRVGAYHRTLSTLLNDLLGAGFALDRIEEPTLDEPGLFAEVPKSMLIAALAR